MKSTNRAVKRKKAGATQPRRVGAETSATRALLLDATEKLMLDEGYAAVTYRRVAAAGGVTAPLVQYYFPTLDDLFVTLLQRRSDHNLDKLTAALELHADAPLRVIWDYSKDETTAALLMEFMALANHRKAIRAEIAEVSERSRKVQLAALSAVRDKNARAGDDIPTSAVLFLLHGIPKLILMESFLGVSVGHRDTLGIVDRYLEWAEPSGPRGKSTSKKSATNPNRKAPATRERVAARRTATARANGAATRTSRAPKKLAAKG